MSTKECRFQLLAARSACGIRGPFIRLYFHRRVPRPHAERAVNSNRSHRMRNGRQAQLVSCLPRNSASTVARTLRVRNPRPIHSTLFSPAGAPSARGACGQQYGFTMIACSARIHQRAIPPFGGCPQYNFSDIAIAVRFGPSDQKRLPAKTCLSDSIDD